MMMFAIVFGLSMDHEVFVLSTSAVGRTLDLGLGASIIIDASVIRLLIVPATMFLLGRYNWWTPRWLDKILPRLNPKDSHLFRRAQRPGRRPVRSRLAPASSRRATGLRLARARTGSGRPRPGGPRGKDRPPGPPRPG